MRLRIAALMISGAAVFLVSPALASVSKVVVQQLYAEPTLAFGGPGSQQVLASDLHGAMSRRSAGVQGASPVDFDYRYGAKETEISGFMLLPQVDYDQA